LEHLDAIYFSPHKFLGGPGTTGILIFDPKLYKNRVPDNPGGGTVMYTNPWGEHVYFEEIEAREDGGTPAFLQTIKVAFAVKLKEEMGVDRMLHREKEILDRIWPALDSMENIHILAPQIRHRLGVISFYIEDLHYNLGVQILNDRFGIQTRGGCSCAGTYGHFLLHVDKTRSNAIKDEITANNLMSKPGWIRMSIHPVMSNEEIDFICSSILSLAKNHVEWAKEYIYDPHTNEFNHRSAIDPSGEMVKEWYEKPII
jgi:selenocysteine lyase/cysteine desulfurase